MKEVETTNTGNSGEGKSSISKKKPLAKIDRNKYKVAVAGAGESTGPGKPAISAADLIKEHGAAASSNVSQTTTKVEVQQKEQKPEVKTVKRVIAFTEEEDELIKALIKNYVINDIPMKHTEIIRTALFALDSLTDESKKKIEEKLHRFKPGPKKN